MLLNVLVRNYFERNNTFDGIENTIIGSRIEAIGESKNETFEQVCYRLLGYDGANDPLALRDLRIALATGEDTSNFSDGSLSDKEMCKELGVKIFGGTALPIKKCKGLDKLVAEYYKRDPNLIIECDGKIMQFGAWLESSKMPFQELLSNSAVQDCFVKFSTASIDTPTIYGGILWTEKPVSEALQTTINKSAVKLIRNKDYVQRLIGKIDPISLIDLADVNRNAYLKIIDYAIASGQSYASLVKTSGIAIPDLIKSYELMGTAFMSVGDDFLAYKHKGWGKTTLDLLTFNALSQAEIGKNPLLADKFKDTSYPFVGYSAQTKSLGVFGGA